MSEVDPDPVRAREGQGESELGGRDGARRRATRPTAASAARSGEAPEHRRRRARRRRPATRPAAATSPRSRTPRRSPTRARAPDPVTVSSRAPARPRPDRRAVLAEAADARATVVLSGHVQPDADALGSTPGARRGAAPPRRPGAGHLPRPVHAARRRWAGCPAPRGSCPRRPCRPRRTCSSASTPPRRAGSASWRRLLDDAGVSVVVDHHASNPGFGDVRLVDGARAGHRDPGRRPARRARRRRRPPAGHLPLRRAGRRHRLLPLRQHPARHPRARRPAAGHRHRPLRHQPPAVRHRAVRLARPAVGGHRPRRARARGRRRRPGVDLVEHRRGRRVRPARRAAGGAGRRRALHRRRPTSPACSRARTTAPGRSPCARAAAPTSPGSRWRSAAAVTPWPPATARYLDREEDDRGACRATSCRRRR